MTLEGGAGDEEIQCCGNIVGALSKLFSQISLADDHGSGRVALMNTLSIHGNLVS